MFADDADWAYPSVDGVPHGGSRKGHGQIGEFFQTLASSEEVLEFAQQDFIAQGNKVVVTGRYKTRIKATDLVVDVDKPVWSLRFDLEREAGRMARVGGRERHDDRVGTLGQRVFER